MTKSRSYLRPLFVLANCLFLAGMIAMCSGLGSPVTPAAAPASGTLSAPTAAAVAKAGTALPMAVLTPIASAPTVPAPTGVPYAVSEVRVSILMYHLLRIPAADDDADTAQLKVSPDVFRQQLSYLQRNGYHTISCADLVGAFDGTVALPDKPVIITFDDGWIDIYETAYPILREYGMSATFFIPANWIGNVDGTASWEQMKEMAAGGMDFGSHSMTHPYLTTSEPDMLEWELQQSKASLEEHLGKPIVALAYPFGLYDDTVIAAVQEAGYRAAFTIDSGSLATQATLFTLPRMWALDYMSDDQIAQVLAE